MTANNKTCTTKPKRDISTTTATTKEAHQPDNMSSSKIADTVSSDALVARAPTLQQDNSQWTGENWLLSPDDIIRLDVLDR